MATAASAARWQLLSPERGAHVLISYLAEDRDAHETERLVEEAGRKAVLAPGDLKQPDHFRAIFAKAVSELGGIDTLVNNAAHQASFRPAPGTGSLWPNYLAMNGHLNRKQFNRCAWCAAIVTVGSAATIFSAIWFLAK